MNETSNNVNQWLADLGKAKKIAIFVGIIGWGIAIIAIVALLLYMLLWLVVQNIWISAGPLAGIATILFLLMIPCMCMALEFMAKKYADQMNRDMHRDL